MNKLLKTEKLAKKINVQTNLKQKNEMKRLGKIVFQNNSSWLQKKWITKSTDLENE